MMNIVENPLSSSILMAESKHLFIMAKTAITFLNQNMELYYYKFIYRTTLQYISCASGCGGWTFYAKRH